MSDKYKPFVYRNLRPSGAHEPPPCVFCGVTTATVADGTTPDGSDTAGFVPVCETCFLAPPPASE